MKTLLRKTIHGALAAIGVGLIILPSTAVAQQGWTGYGVQATAPPAATYPVQAPVWQGYAPSTAWSGPAYAPTGPVVATAPTQPVATPAPGWAGYNPAAAWTGYTPGQAWTGYQPGYISVAPRSMQPRYDRRLVGWGWNQGGGYSEPSTGRRTPMLRPWLPGAAGS